jgi:hypothetical protein
MEAVSLLLAAQAQVQEAARFLGPRPELCGRIVGYTAKPSGRWNTAVLCQELALLRARTVREVLSQAGCANEFSIEGAGYVDAEGSRCTLTLSDPETVQRVQAETDAIAAALLERTRTPSLRVAFRGDSGVKNVTFTHLPLGIVFDEQSPPAVLVIERDSQAAKLGVQAGWLFDEVDGRSVKGLDFSATAKLLQEAAAGLPEL